MNTESLFLCPTEMDISIKLRLSSIETLEAPYCFIVPLTVALTPELSPSTRAYAWYLMGDLAASSHPEYVLDAPDETGLMYYKQALSLDPTLLACWFAILQEYDKNGIGGHTDIALYRCASKILLDAADMLPDDVNDRVKLVMSNNHNFA